jgi:hypothetical protein
MNINGGGREGTARRTERRKEGRRGEENVMGSGTLFLVQENW